MGGGKDGGGNDFPAPKPIDYEALIDQQAELNRVDVTSPYGSSIYSGPDRNRLNITLSPEQQQLLNLSQNVGIQAGQAAQNLAGQLPQDVFQFSNLPALPGVDDFGAERARVEQAQFDRALGLLNPQFEQQREALDANLTARGIPIGGELRDTQLGNLDEAYNRALAQAASDAVTAGGAEQSRLFNLALTGRQQLGQEQLTQRAQPTAEIAGLLGYQPIQQPTSFGPSPVDVVGPAQLASNQALSLYNMGQQNSQASANRQAALMNALIGAGGSVGSMALLGGFGGGPRGGFFS